MRAKALIYISGLVQGALIVAILALYIVMNQQLAYARYSYQLQAAAVTCLLPK